MTRATPQPKDSAAQRFRSPADLSFRMSCEAVRHHRAPHPQVFTRVAHVIECALNEVGCQPPPLICRVDFGVQEDPGIVLVAIDQLSHQLVADE